MKALVFLCVLFLFERTSVSGEDTRPRFNEGAEALRKQEYERAVAIFKGLAAIHPELADAHFDLGQAYWGLEKWDLAKKAYEDALARDPNDAAASKRQIDLIRTRQRQVDAFKAALARNPGLEPAADKFMDGVGERLDRSVVTVVLHAADGDLKARSGGALVEVPGKGRLILTCRHCLFNGDSAEIQAMGKSYPIERVIADDREADIALVSAKMDDQTIEALPLAKAAPRVRDAVVVTGNPLGLGRMRLRGGVWRIHRDEHGHEVLDVTTPFPFGMSGSPVINRHGEVVGVAVGSLADPDNGALWGSAISVDASVKFHYQTPSAYANWSRSREAEAKKFDEANDSAVKEVLKAVEKPAGPPPTTAKLP